MFHLKASPLIDYSDLLSPSVGEVSNALERRTNDEIQLAFLQPEMQVSKTNGNNRQIPQSPPDRKFTSNLDKQNND
jgi:hypothetical protein